MKLVGFLLMIGLMFTSFILLNFSYLILFSPQIILMFLRPYQNPLDRYYWSFNTVSPQNRHATQQKCDYSIVSVWDHFDFSKNTCQNTNNETNQNKPPSGANNLQYLHQSVNHITSFIVFIHVLCTNMQTQVM